LHHRTTGTGLLYSASGNFHGVEKPRGFFNAKEKSARANISEFSGGALTQGIISSISVRCFYGNRIPAL
jgi:hypothetical protein